MGKAVHDLRRTQDAHLLHAQVGDDLCTDTVGAQLVGPAAGLFRLDFRHVVFTNAADQRLRIIFPSQDDHRAPALLRDALQCVVQRPAVVIGMRTQQVAEGVLHVHAHQRRLVVSDISHRYRQMHRIVDNIVVGMHTKHTVLGFHIILGYPLHRLFILDAVADLVPGEAQERGGAGAVAVGAGEGEEVLLTDTVGFIRRLPHHLVESFKATLAEVREADLMVHVVDAGSEDPDHQISSVNRVLHEIVPQEKATLMVFNKMDLVEPELFANRYRRLYPEAVFVSAKQEDGPVRLRDAILARVMGAVLVFLIIGGVLVAVLVAVFYWRKRGVLEPPEPA